MLRASVHTLGCRLSQAETSVLADGLRRKGYRLVPFGEATDLFVLNTCTVTEQAEKDCRYVIRKTLRHSPEAFVAVTGCYAQTGTESLRAIPGIDLLVGTEHKMRLPELLPPPTALRKQSAPDVVWTRRIAREEFTLPGTSHTEATRALLKIQDGCNVMCSFCLIPFARGHERSRALHDVMREAEELVAQGHRELVLTGVNIGRYESNGLGLRELVQMLAGVSGLERIRISSIEPTTVTEALLDYMSGDTKLCRYLHVPMQSGNDRILAAMNRPYNVDTYRRLIERAAQLMPDIGLGTDVMVGFPGEDRAAFEDTETLLTALPFSYFHVFSYSERPGTAALRLPDPVPDQEIASRSRRLADVSARQMDGFRRRFLGQRVRVLFERTLRDGFREGTTEHFLRVAVPASQADANTLEDVLITGISRHAACGEVIRGSQSSTALADRIETRRKLQPHETSRRPRSLTMVP